MLSQINKKKISFKLNQIYNFLPKNEIDHIVEEISQVINHFNRNNKKKNWFVSEKTTMVICYGDSIYSKNKKNLKTFQLFFNKKLKKFIDTIHFLPFYPSSSDSGFAVKDHYKIDNKFGNWLNIKHFSTKAHIMADMVINHASARGLWFKNFLKEKKPGKDYFLLVNSKFNTSKVIRPRDHKLLKEINIFKKKEYLWRTFSDDQIDLNFKNPKVLLRFIKIMLNLIKNGVTIFRLDAIAYLWKESGTKCINLKQTHEIVKVLRIVSNSLNIKTIIVTETNLPEKENLSYFGNNDESNWIYNFSLPPLLIYSLLFENGSYLNAWSKKLPQTKKGNSYLNFIASHDGIGMRPLEGIINNRTIKKLLLRLKKNGSKFSYRKVNNNKKNVYESNITVFDALKVSDKDKKGLYKFQRYIAAHAIMFSFEGVPAIYFNSLFGKSNDEARYVITGNNRDVNRFKWNEFNILKKIKNNSSKEYYIFETLKYLLNIRKKQKAFHPNAYRVNINLGNNFFCVKRVSLDKKQTILCITNLTSKLQNAKINKKFNKFKNLIDPNVKTKILNSINLKPFETIWLSNK
ncbi:alpha-amylase family glycosyl hydrolase [Candidatus Pelagibacter communis]|uniref:alpha-amylase family glycosyl hydrolase n=1 Tax=Pelagibacter ubique TaxID=198252 RepID=UPI00094C3675|nr:alpha-amylase family glycosyl hydrolase [Candidatus Pelagibacter ubique]